MLFLKKPLSIFLLSVSIAALITGCYKKDLDEFKKVNGWTYTPVVVLPFAEKKITLKDTIPKLPFFTTVTMSDTASIELPGSKSKDTLESIVDYIDFKVRLENTFPFSGVVQVYFSDSNNVYVDSLLNNSERIVGPGNPSVVKEMIISVDKERYIKLTQKAKNMYLYYKLTTSDISGLQNSYLQINMGMKAKLTVNLDKNSNL